MQHFAALLSLGLFLCTSSLHAEVYHRHRIYCHEDSRGSVRTFNSYTPNSRLGRNIPMYEVLDSDSTSDEPETEMISDLKNIIGIHSDSEKSEILFEGERLSGRNETQLYLGRLDLLRRTGRAVPIASLKGVQPWERYLKIYLAQPARSYGVAKDNQYLLVPKAFDSRGYQILKADGLEKVGTLSLDTKNYFNPVSVHEWTFFTYFFDKEATDGALKVGLLAVDVAQPQKQFHLPYPKDGKRWSQVTPKVLPTGEFIWFEVFKSEAQFVIWSPGKNRQVIPVPSHNKRPMVFPSYGLLQTEVGLEVVIARELFELKPKPKLVIGQFEQFQLLLGSNKLKPVATNRYPEYVFKDWDSPISIGWQKFLIKSLLSTPDHKLLFAGLPGGPFSPQLYRRQENGSWQDVSMYACVQPHFVDEIFDDGI